MITHRSSSAYRSPGLGIGLLLAVLVAAPAGAMSDGALSEALAGYGAHRALRGGVVSCEVADLQTGRILYSLHPDQGLIPASNMKLFVSATAVALFGTQFEFSTSLWARSEPGADGVVRGHLYLVGCADPAATPKVFAELARQLRARGVKAISGDLVGTAPVLVGDHDAGLRGARRMGEALGAAGIRLGGVVRAGMCPSAPCRLARHSSQSLADYLRYMNKESRNPEADRLLQSVLACFDDPVAASPAFALRYWAQRGLTTSGLRVADGSGYSRSSRLSAGLLRGLLSWTAASPDAYRVLSASLPIAGCDGTLGDRMCGTVAEGRVRAKTGTLPGVSCLSGYVERAGKPRLAFSVMMNGFSCSVETARRIQDQMAIVMARYVHESPH
jgi:D-alanyl-D-alanine carboxypeptidase/D-alanyl-D-alanine-endopeptidase (penicillin-binding protein 4)